MKMFHYVSQDKDGNIHVQNTVEGHLMFAYGQHHVHTPADFFEWRKEIDKAVIKEADRPCPCKMKPGEVREGGAR